MTYSLGNFGPLQVSNISLDFMTFVVIITYIFLHYSAFSAYIILKHIYLLRFFLYLFTHNTL